jgi:hypothetical protein
MLEMHNGPRALKLMHRDDNGVRKTVAVIRKDNLEVRGEELTPELDAEVQAIVQLFRTSRQSWRSSVLVQLSNVLQDGLEYYSNCNDPLERSLIRDLVVEAFKGIRRADSKRTLAEGAANEASTAASQGS